MTVPRRLAIVACLMIAATSCAAKPIALRVGLIPDQVRVYTLHSEARTLINTPELRDDEKTSLDADVTVRVGKASAGGTSVVIEVVPVRLVRDGVEAEPPEATAAALTVTSDGDVKDVKPVGSAQLALGGSSDDLGGLLGSALRRNPVAVGDRWQNKLQGDSTGYRSLRAAALRMVGGRRCVIVETRTERTVVRERRVASQSLRLAGTESATATTAAAIDEGFPVRISADAVGEFTVQGSGGSVRITTRSSITYGRRVKPLPRFTPQPEPETSPSPKVTPKPSKPTKTVPAVKPTASVTAMLADNPGRRRRSA